MAGGGLGPEWGKAPCLLLSWTLRGQLLSSAVDQPSALLGQGPVPAASLGTAVGLWGCGKMLHLEVKAVCRGPSGASGDPYTILPSLPCRAQDSQSYSRFPSLTQVRTALTDQNLRNPQSNSSSVCPADPSSLRVDGHKLTIFTRGPRNVSLGSAD